MKFTNKFRQGLAGVLASVIISVFPGCSSHQRVPELPFKSLTETQLDIENNIKRIREPEGEDVWNSAKKTEETREGDCEDIAIYIARDGEKLGYPPLILDLMGVNRETGKEVRYWAYLIRHEFPDGRVQYGALQKYIKLFEEYFPTNDRTNRVFKGYNTIEEVVQKINDISKEETYYSYSILNLNDLKFNWRTTNRNLKDKEAGYPDNTQKAAFFLEDYKRVEGEVAEKIEHALGLKLCPEN